VSTFDPNANNTAEEIIIDGTNIIVCGYFTRFETTNRNYACAMRISTGEINNWNPSPDYIVYEATYNSSHIYLGGAFHNVNGAGRNCIASFNISSEHLKAGMRK
jgi:hypothetical protein